MKPLYLSGTEKTKVVLDGPALRITRPASADLRAPLLRLSRVVVSGSVSWTTEALLACADASVPVVFLRRDGSVRARWLGFRSRGADLERRWSWFVDRPDWRDLHDHWKRPAVRRAMTLSARRMSVSPDCPPQELHARLTEPVRLAIGDLAWSRLRKRLRGVIQAHATAFLANAGLRWTDTAADVLLDDLVDIATFGLLPELHADILRPVADMLQAEDQRSIAAFLERHRETTDFHLHLGLGSFLRFLEELPD